MNCVLGECVGGPFDGGQFEIPDMLDGDVEIKADDVGKFQFRGMRATYKNTGKYAAVGMRTIYFFDFIPGTETTVAH